MGDLCDNGRKDENLRDRREMDLIGMGEKSLN